ncbi:MAG: hypothetical protein AABW88_01720 [Nanoarchaeota archaeon]
MALLNRLFGNKTNESRKLVLADSKRIILWDQSIKNYKKKEELSRYFKFGNLKNPSKDFWENLPSVLNKIRSLISDELINIKSEKKTNNEILSDMKKLISEETIDKIHGEIQDERNMNKNVLKNIKRIHDILKVELHAIDASLKNPRENKEMLEQVFTLIFHHEAAAYQIFQKESFFKESLPKHERIKKIAKAIILEQKLKEEIETDEDKFVSSAIKIIGNENSKHQLRRLAEDIYSELAEKVGGTTRRNNIEEAIKDLEKAMKRDEILFEIIKKLRPTYNDEKIRQVMYIFRKAYNLGHLLGQEAQFAT